MVSNNPRRKKSRINYPLLRQNAIRGRDIFRNNLLIATTTGMLILLSIPVLAQTLFRTLFIYSYDNVDISGFQFIFTGEVGLGDSLLQGIVQLIISGVFDLILGELLWIATWIGRLVRFAYLTIMALMVLYLLLFYLFSLVMQTKIRFSATFISLFISSLISFGIVFFLVPNNQQFLDWLVLKINEIEVSGELLLDIPLLATEIIYNFYIGFFLTIVIHLFITTMIQIQLRDF